MGISKPLKTKIKPNLRQNAEFEERQRLKKKSERNNQRQKR